MVRNELRLKADFKLGDLWSVPDPVDFIVQKEEPLRKSISVGDSVGFIPAQALSLIFALRESGLLEWVRQKSFDGLWDYLKLRC
jgi:hypothetical protein